MRVCIVGAGAIGGLLGVKLALSGNDVTLIARGPHLDAINNKGLKLVLKGGSEYVARDLKATRHIHEAGPQDVVILAVKAHQIAPIAADLQVLYTPDTTVVTTQNGIPWWYFQRHGGEFDNHRIEAVDPGGVIASNIDADRIIGAIVYPAAEISEPGVIRHIEGDRFPIGELDGAESDRVKAISKMFIDAGFKSPVIPDVRSELWLKAWGNLTFNPISALTHSTLVDICQYPPTRQLATMMMTEAQAVANKLGISFRVPLEKRINGAQRVGKHKTSMLQDVEAGKAVEANALIGAVVELGELTNTPTPHINAVYACVKLLSKTMVVERISIKGQLLESQRAKSRLRAV
ncbi:MAG: 2-dehydropantoate 2-reductase [Gammaproteobacteria bacterium]|jgi:2-dehydropantoate 2-reductase|nr:2-dehydropantoate 2-reductase [Gammaproteobacteria bacterium]